MYEPSISDRMGSAKGRRYSVREAIMLKDFHPHVALRPASRVRLSSLIEFVEAHAV